MSVFDYMKARQLILANASETIDKLEKEIAETGYYIIKEIVVAVNDIRSFFGRPVSWE